MRSSRWHALGNVYLLVERDKGCSSLTPALVRELCADADGIVEVVRAGRTEAEVVIWNRDGSTAELSGNGTRIAARWLAERTGADEVQVRVRDRVVTARIRAGGAVETDVGEVEVRPSEVVDGIVVVPVSVGNPHAVVERDPAEIGRLGPLLSTHPRFPDGTNVEIARVDRPGELTARVWERGVGETASSGTGAVAVAAALHGEGDAVITFPGGEQRVRLAGGRAFLTGPAEEISRRARAPGGFRSG